MIFSMKLCVFLSLISFNLWSQNTLTTEDLKDLQLTKTELEDEISKLEGTTAVPIEKEEDYSQLNIDQNSPKLQLVSKKNLLDLDVSALYLKLCHSYTNSEQLKALRETVENSQEIASHKKALIKDYSMALKRENTKEFCDEDTIDRNTAFLYKEKTRSPASKNSKFSLETKKRSFQLKDTDIDEDFQIRLSPAK